MTNTAERKEFRRDFIRALRRMHPRDTPWQWTHRHYACREVANNCQLSKIVHHINEEREDVLLRTTHIRHPNGDVTFGVACYALRAE